MFEAAEAERAKREKGAPEVLTVTAVTALIKRTLEAEFPNVWVVGQVSNLTRASSGHVYLTLKDEGAEIGAVIWRATAGRIPFRIEDGQEINVQGKIAVYERRGRYQIVVNNVQPKGMGALQLAFLQMKEKLEKEGLFETGRKKPLPFLPGVIALVTSPTGAAIHDMLTMIFGRLPQAHVVICPVAVQGKEAAPQIAAAIRGLNRMAGIDVMIVGRGGGSIEDLSPFNEEVVARAIAASEIPVISAVGHEVDVSISDLVADVRALTPTQAGEMVVPARELLDERLSTAGRRLAQALVGGVKHARARLDTIARSYGMRAPIERVHQQQQRLDEIAERMRMASAHQFGRLAEHVAHAAATLDTVNPTNVLARGYSMTMLLGEDRPLRSSGKVRPGVKLRTILFDGEFRSTADTGD